MESLGELEKKISYEFESKALLKRAMSHSSYSNETAGDPTHSNERLEFLGDAILEASVSLYLFRAYPAKQEGELTRMRASLVCERSLGSCGKAFGLQQFLLLGKGEELSGGRERISIIADAVEALIGAVYLDGGFEEAKKYIIRFILESQDGFTVFNDSKTVLQELVQGKGQEPPRYRITGFKGPEHRRIFMCEVLIGNKKMGEGEGTSKKGAEQNAARKALDAMREEA